jgi:hypothetical protein
MWAKTASAVFLTSSEIVANDTGSSLYENVHSVMTRQRRGSNDNKPSDIPSLDG